MLGSTFYHETVRKYVAVFGTLFNDIDVERKDSAGTVTEKIKVPLAYGPREKFLTRISTDPSLNPKIALTVPRMGFELLSMTYDGVRKLNTIGRNVKAGTTSGLKKQFNPVPYNWDFSLYVYIKNAEDGTQILEQILPFFTPEFTVTMNLVSSMSEKRDVPLVLTSVTSEDTYEGDFATRRSIIWTLSFIFKGFLYPDITDNAKVITTSVVDTHLMSAVADSPEYIIAEDSTPYNVNYMVLDKHDTDTSTRIRILNESSDKAIAEGRTVSRTTVVPKDIDAITDDAFGFTETFDFYEQGITHDSVAGTDN